MVEVVVIAEGQTEEQFVKLLVAPALNHLQVYLKAQTLPTSATGRGGAVSFDRLKLHARNTLRQKSQPVVTTLIDLYALDTDFPGYREAQKQNGLERRLQCLEGALHREIVADAGCLPERFIPYIQPHEFEGLLFSDPQALATTEPGWKGSEGELKKVRAKYETPEHINGGPNTHPSMHLEKLLAPRYKKTRHGPLAAQKITLPVIEGECAHFRAWLERLRGLARR